jgi:hypothetical protein
MSHKSLRRSLSGGYTLHRSLSGGYTLHRSLSGGYTLHRSLSGGYTLHRSLSGGYSSRVIQENASNTKHIEMFEECQESQECARVENRVR